MILLSPERKENMTFGNVFLTFGMREHHSQTWMQPHECSGDSFHGAAGVSAVRGDRLSRAGS